MKTERLITVLTCLILFAMLVTAPLIYADTEGTSTGSAEVGNVAPTITNLGLYNSAESSSVNDTAIDPWTEYHTNCTLTDSNTVADLVNVTWVIWEDTYADWDSADDVDNHFTLKYDQDTNTWSEVGPGSTHIVAGSCNCICDTDNTTNTGEFELAFKLDKVANYTGASHTWNINVTTFDSGDNSDTETDLIFGTNWYGEITVSDASHGWTGLSPGDDDILLTSPGDFDIDMTATANANFDIQAKANDTVLTDGTHTFNIGNVTIHEDTQGSSASLTTSYVDIGGLTDEDRGTDQAKACQLWISVPETQATGTYEYELSLKVEQHT